MRTSLLCACVLALSCGAPPSPPLAVSSPPASAPDVDATKSAIARVLDDLHDAAAHADEARYFAHFAADGVFLGTDATERWELPAFRAFAHPYFAKGKAWTFRATRRAIALSADGRVAWFDEDLATEKLGPARGSGALVLVAGEWKIEQYNLAIVVPNDHFGAVRALLDRLAQGPSPAFGERYEKEHAVAVDHAKRGDFASAVQALRDLAVLAEAGPIVELYAVSLHYEQMLLRWLEGDLATAHAELDAYHAAYVRSGAMGNMAVSMAVGEQWSRAFVLGEMAHAAPPTLRAQALAAATRARAGYAERATAIGQQASVAALDAFFAVRAGDAKAALAAAMNPYTSTDVEPLHLYLVALAFDLGKDRARADATRARLRGLDDSIEKHVVLAKIARDAKP